MSGARFLKGPKTPILTALPTGLAASDDGLEINFLADAANGVVWRLRYRHYAADGVTLNSSPYKWEYVGGPPLSAFVATSESMSGSVYVDLTTVGPQILAPLAGEYRAQFVADASNNIALNLSLAAVKFGAAATVDADAAVAQHAGASAGDTIGRVLERRTVAAAGTVIKLQYRTNANFSQFLRRLLEITPLRVG